MSINLHAIGTGHGQVTKVLCHNVIRTQLLSIHILIYLSYFYPLTLPLITIGEPLDSLIVIMEPSPRLVHHSAHK